MVGDWDGAGGSHRCVEVPGEGEKAGGMRVTRSTDERKELPYDVARVSVKGFKCCRECPPGGEMGKGK